MTDDVHQLTSDAPLLILGDSLVAGEGAEGDFGWAKQIAAQTPADIVGVCGATSADILTHLPDRAYDQVLVQIGTNDARFRHGRNATETTLEQYRYNLCQIARHFYGRNRATRLSFVDLLFVDETRTVLFKPDRSYFNADLQRVAGALAAFCAEKDFDRIATDALPRRPDALSDGLHPTTASHAQLAAIVQDAIGPAMAGEARVAQAAFGANRAVRASTR